MIKYVPHTLSYTVLKVYFLKTLALPFIQYQRINDFQSSTLRVHTTCARAARVSWGGRWRCRPHPKIQDDQQTHAFSVVFPRIVAKARLYDAPHPKQISLNTNLQGPGHIHICPPGDQSTARECSVHYCAVAWSTFMVCVHLALASGPVYPLSYIFRGFC